jgi:multimeric flavodoxin WrbA
MVIKKSANTIKSSSKVKPLKSSSKVKPLINVRKNTSSKVKTLNKSSKVLIVKQKENKNYLDYIKQNKYKFITSGLLVSGGLTYITYNKNQGKELYEKIKNDSELENKLSTIGSQVIIKVVDHYIQDVIKNNLNNGANNVNKAINGNDKKNIINIGNKLGNVLNDPVNTIQDAIAHTMVPQELKDDPKLLNKINTIIIKNVNNILIDRSTTDKIEKYLINKGIIESNCSKYNILTGSFPCEEDEKKQTYEKVLKYFSDENLLKQVNEYIKQILLKEAELFLLNEKKIENGCTKFNKGFLYSTQCKDQKLADKLIQDKLNELLKK